MAQTHELTLHIAASVEDVFATITDPRAPGQDSEDTLLEARSLRGTPGVAGHVTLFRWAAGEFDLLVEETLMATLPPRMIHSSFRVAGLQNYDPAERLPPFFDGEPANPDRAFRMMFGADPQPWELRITLDDSDGGTCLTCTARMPDAPRRMFGFGRKPKPPPFFANLQRVKAQLETPQVQ